MYRVAKLYPPQNEDARRVLHANICNSSLTEHHKLSILYYLLLDWDLPNPSNSLSDNFAIAASVPSQYHIFMRGLWFLDKRECESAVQYLADPSLPTAEFSDEIIIALISQSKKGDYSLPLAYYHTVKPSLKTHCAIESLFEAMARTNVVAALEFSRQYSDCARQLLFQQLIIAVLDEPSREYPADRATQLVSLPFDTAEEKWFEDYLTQSDGKKLRKSADTLLMRKIATGKYTDVLGNKNIGGRWGIVLEGFRNGVGQRTG